MSEDKRSLVISRPTALKFVVLLGVVSLCADATYEGARSITGPYLLELGATGTVVGVVAGLGELIGYALRLLSGYLSDRTHRYWAMTICGYVMNLVAVPCLVFAGNWPVAAALLILERMGKGVRAPARDAMLSYATKEIGRGWGFGLHEALDQVGAIVGPVMVTLVFVAGGSYRIAFLVLGIPAVVAIGVLLIARSLYPRPQDLEPATQKLRAQGLPWAYWIYLVAAGMVAAAYADFPLIAYHFGKAATVPETWIPIFYALAMGVDAVAALCFGHWFDRLGIPVLMVASAISALFAPLVFAGGFGLALLGMILWGIGMGAQESILRAAIAQMVPQEIRGSAYGIFNTGFGVSWFLGSALMGILYDVSITSLIIFSMFLQLISIPIFFSVGRCMAHHGTEG